MKVTNKPMYHFHRLDNFDDLWIEGNEILVDDNFNSSFSNILKTFNTAVNTIDGRTSLNIVINKYLEEEQTEQMLLHMLRDASEIIYKTNIFKREKALEEVRQEKYSHLPSRKHSIWVTDKKGLQFWKKVLYIPEQAEQKLALLKVSITGDLFKSSDYLLPAAELTYDETIKAAEDYWNPDYSKIAADRSEYLFQGKLKILKRLK